MDNNISNSLITQNANAIVNLEQRQSQLESDFEQLSSRVDTFDKRIQEAEAKAANAEDIVNQLKEKLGDIESNEQTVQARLAKIEEAMTQLIDFGEYPINF